MFITIIILFHFGKIKVMKIILGLGYLSTKYTKKIKTKHGLITFTFFLLFMFANNTKKLHRLQVPVTSLFLEYTTINNSRAAINHSPSFVYRV
jgi:hypothetical protein